MWMNEWDIEEARERYARHPVLGPATKTLVNLVEATNRCSDGWCYWPKPGRAAAKLMALIEGDDPRVVLRDRERLDATPAKLKAALTPLKAFRTRQGMDFEIVDGTEVNRPFKIKVVTSREYIFREGFGVNVTPIYEDDDGGGGGEPSIAEVEVEVLAICEADARIVGGAVCIPAGPMAYVPIENFLVDAPEAPNDARVDLTCRWFATEEEATAYAKAQQSQWDNPQPWESFVYPASV